MYRRDAMSNGYRSDAMGTRCRRRHIKRHKCTLLLHSRYIETSACSSKMGANLLISSAWIWMGVFSVDKVGLLELGATRFLCSVDVVCLAWILHQHFCPVCA